MIDDFKKNGWDKKAKWCLSYHRNFARIIFCPLHSTRFTYESVGIIIVKKSYTYIFRVPTKNVSFGGITIDLCLSKTYKDRSLYSFDSFEVRITSPLLVYEKSNFLNDVFIRECQAILKTKKGRGSYKCVL